MQRTIEIYTESIGQRILAFTEKVLLIDKTLVISDVHLGKVSHFRKAGFALPLKARNANYDLMTKLILEINPERVVFLGDLFHSEINDEWADFVRFLSNPSFNCTWVLVEGNHDILNPELYENAGLSVADHITMENLILTHEPMSTVPEGFINVHGHIHPGVTLKGKARQRATVSCFHFRHPYLCVPAFGRLTGLAKMDVGKNDKCFAILEEGIFEVEKNR